MTDQSKDTAGVIAFPPLLLAAALGFAVVLGFVLPLGILPDALSPISLIPGLALFSLAGLLGLSGIIAFRAAGTNIEPHKPTLVLVYSGPYRLTRNPMYLGLLMLHLAVTLLASLDWGVLTVIPLALLLHFGVILREERYLAAKFGKDYQNYLNNTRRWI